MAGRIDDEKLYKRSLNHEPTKSVSTLNIFQLDFTFFDLKQLFYPIQGETLTLTYNNFCIRSLEQDLYTE